MRDYFGKCLSEELDETASADIRVKGIRYFRSLIEEYLLYLPVIEESLLNERFDVTNFVYLVYHIDYGLRIILFNLNDIESSETDIFIILS